MLHNNVLLLSRESWFLLVAWPPPQLHSKTPFAVNAGATLYILSPSPSGGTELVQCHWGLFHKSPWSEKGSITYVMIALGPFTSYFQKKMYFGANIDGVRFLSLDPLYERPLKEWQTTFSSTFNPILKCNTRADRTAMPSYPMNSQGPREGEL